MTRRTLTDELNSVLREHSLQAPEPGDTVDRILADTVGASSAASSSAGRGSDGGSRRWWPSGPGLVAASIVAVLVLVAAGINAARHPSGRQTTTSAGTANSSGPRPADGTATAAFGNGSGLGSKAPAHADQPATVPPPAAPPTYVGSSLNCSKVPAGRLETGAWAGVRLSATGQVRYAYEFRCVGANGERSASEVQIFEPVGGVLKYLQSLPLAAGEHVDAILGGIDSLRIQSSTPYLITGVVSDAVEVTTYQFDDRGVFQSSDSVDVPPCARKDLTATLTSRGSGLAGGQQFWLLALVNRTSVPCALEGFPKLQTAQDGKPLGAQFRQTLSGSAGGVTKSSVPPIIVLKPGASAAAVIEAAVPAPINGCSAGSQVAVTLPDGVSLGTLPASLPACGLVVHPLVGNASGSD